MDINEVMKIMAGKRNGTFTMVDYISDKSYKLDRFHKDWLVIKKASASLQCGLDYGKVNDIEFDEDSESDYTYDIPKKVCHKVLKNGKTHYYVVAYPNPNKVQNHSEWFIVNGKGVRVDEDLHNIMQPSYFNNYSDIKRPHIKIDVEHIVGIR